jgi:hypothetical protein
LSKGDPSWVTMIAGSITFRSPPEGLGLGSALAIVGFPGDLTISDPAMWGSSGRTNRLDDDDQRGKSCSRYLNLDTFAVIVTDIGMRPSMA